MKAIQDHSQHRIRRNGLDRRGYQRFYCRDCRATFYDPNRIKNKFHGLHKGFRAPYIKKGKSFLASGTPALNKHERYRRKLILSGRCPRDGNDAEGHYYCATCRLSSRLRYIAKTRGIFREFPGNMWALAEWEDKDA